MKLGAVLLVLSRPEAAACAAWGSEVSEPRHRELLQRIGLPSDDDQLPFWEIPVTAASYLYDTIHPACINRRGEIRDGKRTLHRVATKAARLAVDASRHPAYERMLAADWIDQPIVGWSIPGTGAILAPLAAAGLEAARPVALFPAMRKIQGQTFTEWEPKPLLPPYDEYMQLVEDIRLANQENVG